jgi:hypothetical protein
LTESEEKSYIEIQKQIMQNEFEIKRDKFMEKFKQPAKTEPDYTHLLPEGCEFCTEEDAEKWVKVECPSWYEPQSPLGTIELDEVMAGFQRQVKELYRPIHPIQYHISVHESVTAKPDKYTIEKHGDTWVILEPSPKDNNWTIVGKFHDDRVASYIFGLLKGFKDAEPDPYQVDWENAPGGAVGHYYASNGFGSWIITGAFDHFNGESGHTLPSGLDWKQSLRVNPKLK